MECPHCGKTDDEVIDSRLTKEGIAIRRRRQCLSCGGRFTTYESREEQLPLVLIRKDAGPGATIANLKMVLGSMSKGFRALTRETEKLIVRAERLEKAEAAKQSKRKPAGKVGARVAARKKGPVKKRAARKPKAPVKKPGARKKMPDSTVVLKIIKRHKKGVGISKLKDRTGFDDTKVRNIISIAYKQGKIKRVGRGVYVAA
jgi:transcriptional repressor NrdR